MPSGASNLPPTPPFQLSNPACAIWGISVPIEGLSCQDLQGRVAGPPDLQPQWPGILMIISSSFHAVQGAETLQVLYFT